MTERLAGMRRRPAAIYGARIPSRHTVGYGRITRTSGAPFLACSPPKVKTFAGAAPTGRNMERRVGGGRWDRVSLVGRWLGRAPRDADFPRRTAAAEAEGRGQDEKKAARDKGRRKGRRGQRKGREGKGREGKEREGKGREGKGEAADASEGGCEGPPEASPGRSSSGPFR